MPEVQAQLQTELSGITDRMPELLLEKSDYKTARYCIFAGISDVDFLVLEANHEKNILLMGKYPYNLKTRILGDYGHLSNEGAGEALTRILQMRNKPISVALAHLSSENNTPDMARVTVKNILFENDYMEGRDYSLTVLKRDIVGDVIRI